MWTFWTNSLWHHCSSSQFCVCCQWANSLQSKKWAQRLRLLLYPLQSTLICFLSYSFFFLNSCRFLKKEYVTQLFSNSFQLTVFSESSCWCDKPWQKCLTVSLNRPRLTHSESASRPGPVDRELWQYHGVPDHPPAPCCLSAHRGPFSFPGASAWPHGRSAERHDG